MVFSNNPFKVLIFLLLVPFVVFCQDYPKPLPKPEVPKKIYQEVFKAIKKQNWPLAKVLADEYDNKNFSSYVRWLDITRPGSKYKFEDLLIFFENHRDWPKTEIIRKKIESSINSKSNVDKVISWFAKNSPLTVKGAIDYMEFKEKKGILQNKAKIIRDIWVNQNLTHTQQKYFIRKYSRYWNSSDNWKRFDRLLWEGKNWSAKKTLQRIKGDYRKLGDARLALSNRAGNVSYLINRVPKYLRNEPGLIYERMRWRRKAKLPTAANFLLKPPEEIKNYRNWWINARIVIRREINKKNYNLAYKMLQNHQIPLTFKSGVEAEWLSGWIAYNFIRNRENALKHFVRVFNNAKTKFTQSNAAYWIGEVYYSQNQLKKSQDWYKISANTKLSFYGNHAKNKLKNFRTEDSNYFKKKPDNIDHIIEILSILQNANEGSRAFVFLKKAFYLCNSNEEKNYVMNIASKFKNKNYLVNLSKLYPEVSVKYSYPTILDLVPEKFDNKNDITLIHSIILQESAFKVSARSHAGARGLMQLMPYTAKRVANSIKLKYYLSSLTTNPQYNILLGTTYIKGLLKRFDNSLPLALAGYNAGPARVKIWLKRYGDPRKGEISFINWIESIPIYETRNYVKRVIGNYSIYSGIFEAEDIKDDFRLFVKK